MPAGDVPSDSRSDMHSGSSRPSRGSWPQRTSDHPGAPWYGIGTCPNLDILTKNPEGGARRSLSQCCSENNGLLRPTSRPSAGSGAPGNGQVSAGLDPSPEWGPAWQGRVRAAASRIQNADGSSDSASGSPWSSPPRGARAVIIIPQIFDHTPIRTDVVGGAPQSPERT